jgi:hypothetical protein
MTKCMSRRSEEVKVYLEAARRILAGEVVHETGACCIALQVADELGIAWWEEDKFYHLFKPRDNFNELWWGTQFGKSQDKRKECRALALCFMAAMVKAGDA